MAKLLIDVSDGEVVDFPAPMNEIVKLDFVENAPAIGVRGWCVPLEDGSRFQLRIGMSDWTAMQLLHLLQQYAQLRGLKPVSTPGAQPPDWHPYPAKN